MTALAITAPVVSIVNHRPVTTSKAIADYFHKQHKNVLQKIDALAADLPVEWYELNFKPMEITVEIGLGKTRQDPAREITRDGFTLLAMGFTGKRALEWKLKYIDAFNQMEATLTGQQPERLTPAQQRTLQEAVSARTAGLTDQQKHLAFPRIWGGVKTTFRVPSYKELDSSQFEDALSYINHYPLEGELLLKETAVLPETRAKLNISYPISCWANGAANMPKIDQSGMVAVLVGNIIGGDYYSPIHHLLRQLEQEGYDISACKLEIMSLRSHLENLHNILRDIEHRAGYNRHFRIKA